MMNDANELDDCGSCIAAALSDGLLRNRFD
jgi:hypothetical protein